LGRGERHGPPVRTTAVVRVMRVQCGWSPPARGERSIRHRATTSGCHTSRTRPIAAGERSVSRPTRAGCTRRSCTGSGPATTPAASSCAHRYARVYCDDSDALRAWSLEAPRPGFVDKATFHMVALVEHCRVGAASSTAQCRRPRRRRLPRARQPPHACAATSDRAQDGRAEPVRPAHVRAAVACGSLGQAARRTRVAMATGDRPGPKRGGKRPCTAVPDPQREP
jgi:hypothetical protein